MTISELEQQLLQAREACEKAWRAGDWEAYEVALSVQLALERQIAAEKGEPYAVPLPFPVKWDVGAPSPHLLMNENYVFLTFDVTAPHPDWDGIDTPLHKEIDILSIPTALVQFHRCMSVKLGAPNDEVFESHPLSGRGQNPYTAQTVENSPWITEIQAINSVHRLYNPDNWHRYKHYVFWFHDTTFECVAESFSIQLYFESFPEVLTRICRMLLE